MTGNHDAERDRLKCRLWISFEHDVLEDGMGHPADQIIESALKSPDPAVLAWLREFSLGRDNPWFASSVLKCVGRQPDPGTSEWRAGLVKDALAADDLEMRASAVDAAGEWLDTWNVPAEETDKRLVGVLEEHAEQDEWLAGYIRDLIEETRGG